MIDNEQILKIARGVYPDTRCEVELDCKTKKERVVFWNWEKGGVEFNPLESDADAFKVLEDL